MMVRDVNEGRDVAGVTVPRLRAFRQARLWTQRELAQRARVTETTVSHAERGMVLRYATVRKLATALEVEPTALCEDGQA